MHTNCRITIQSLGEGVFRRYVLVNRRNEVWGADGWSPDVRRAVLFADIRGAHEAYQAIQADMCEGLPLREFEAVVRIRACSEADFTLEDLRDYLARATRLSVDTQRMGDGPVDGSVVLQTADFSRLLEVPPPKDRPRGDG